MSLGSEEPLMKNPSLPESETVIPPGSHAKTSRKFWSTKSNGGMEADLKDDKHYFESPVLSMAFASLQAREAAVLQHQEERFCVILRVQENLVIPKFSSISILMSPSQVSGAHSFHIRAWNSA